MRGRGEEEEEEEEEDSENVDRGNIEISSSDYS